MTKQELTEALIANVRDADEDKLLGTDGHYAFAITCFVRPETSAGEAETHIGCVTFTLGTDDVHSTPPGEVVAAIATKQVMTEKAPEIMGHVQRALVKRKENWND